jgi:alpha-glucosidase
MWFQDGLSRTVLSEIGDAGRARPFSLSPPAAGDPAGLRRPVLYAPLAFTVGSERILTSSSLLWAGNLASATRSGTQFSARTVRSVEPIAHGVRLIVTTSAPGRRLIVGVVINRGAIQVSARVNPGQGVVGVSDSFASAPGEAFRGFGGRHNSLDQRGQAFYNWVEEENFATADTNGTGGPAPQSSSSTDLFPGGPTAAYDPQALFVSSRAYGFLLENPELSRFRMASDRSDAWQADVSAPRIDYVVAPGSAPRAIAALTAINGRQRVPPEWALGPQLDRAVSAAATYADRVREDLGNIDRYHIKLSAYRLEGWNLLTRGQQKSFIAALHRRGIRALVYFMPSVSDPTLETDDPAVYEQAIRGGYVTRTASGGPYVIPLFGGGTALIDFTNPAAVRWWRARIRAALDLGADGFMEDLGEQVSPDMVFHSGLNGVAMHNAYPILYHRVTHAVLDEYQRQHPHRSFFVYTRSGYSGTPGAAAYENANFAGDETSDWTRASGLQSIITDMLNRGIGGDYGYTTDIGGYEDALGVATTKELFLRWSEAAALTPFFRVHNSSNHGTHTPWSFDAETLRTWRQMAALHGRAMPLILRLWAQADRSGLPITRPLWLAYPRDPIAAQQDQEWLLGPDMLVAPVVSAGATSRSVYVPAGCWRAAHDGRRVHGPGAYRILAPLDQLPYFIRCGTNPLGPSRSRVP